MKKVGGISEGNMSIWPTRGLQGEPRYRDALRSFSSPPVLFILGPGCFSINERSALFQYNKVAVRRAISTPRRLGWHIHLAFREHYLDLELELGLGLNTAPIPPLSNKIVIDTTVQTVTSVLSPCGER